MMVVLEQPSQDDMQTFTSTLGAIREVGMPAWAGETLFLEGEECDAVVEIRRGVARAVSFSSDGDRQVLAFFFPGDFLGLPLTRHHRFSAEAVDRLLYVRRPPADLQADFRCDHRSENRANEAIWREEKAFMRRGQILGRVGALARVSAFLEHVTPRLPRHGELFDFPFPQTDIASYLSLSPETVCRTLRQLRELRIIAMPRKDRITIQSAQRLATIAEG